MVQTDARILLICGFLCVSLVANFGFSWQAAKTVSSSQAHHVHRPHVVAITDTDNDGVPDHHDSCPFATSSCSGEMCPPAGWKSGRATDFDGDGCADGLQDKDVDNDGILDERDSCPYTPQEHRFVSNAGSDFDGDGCADSIEDSDDDNDSVPNLIDACPLTSIGAASDENGCSNLQRKLQSKMKAPQINDANEDATAADELSAKPTYLESWLDAVHGAGIETVVGAVVAAVMGQMWIWYMKAQTHVASKIPFESWSGGAAPAHLDPSLSHQFSTATLSSDSISAPPQAGWNAALAPTCAIAYMRK